MADGRLVISVRVGRTFDDYDAETQWRGAIEDGALRPDTVVTVARGDEPQFSTHARDVPELAELFREILGVGIVEPPPPEPPADEEEAPTEEADQEPPTSGPQDDTPAAAGSGAGEVIIPDLGGQQPPAPPSPPPAPSKPKPIKPKPGDRTGWRHPFVIAGSVLIALLLVLRFAVGVDLPSFGGGGRSGDMAGVEGSRVTVYTVRNVNLRAWASRNATEAGELDRGVELRGVWVEGEGEQWFRITDGVHAGALVLGVNVNSTRPPMLRGTGGVMQVMAASEIYTHPNAGAGTGVIRSLAPGETVNAVGETDSGWVEVTVEGRGVGYVPAAAFVAPEPPPEEAYDLAAEQAAAAAAAAVRECRTQRTISRGVETEQTYCRGADGVWRPNGPPRFVGRVEPTKPSLEAPPPPPAPSPPPVIRRADYLETPFLDDYYPERALRERQRGRVSMNCRVMDGGRVTDCRVVEESPPSLGFADAARRSLGDVRVAAVDHDGHPTAGRRIRLPFAFVPPD